MSRKVVSPHDRYWRTGAKASSIYRRHVREGKVFAPIGRNYLVFVRQTLDAKGRGVAFRQREKELTVLDDLK